MSTLNTMDLAVVLTLASLTLVAAVATLVLPGLWILATILTGATALAIMQTGDEDE